MKKAKKAICVGTGLVALDVVMNGNPNIPLKIFAGGSCGNVLAILSFLNWKTYPIARLNNNKAAIELISDLNKWKVNTSLITQSEDGSTPIIIQRIKKDSNGNSIHRFEFKDPDSGKWLPSYKAVLSDSVQLLMDKSPIPNVFYFDRITRSSIDLAKYYKELGALIYFEPSSIGKIAQFEECLKIADVLKFSNERIKDYSRLFNTQRVALEIETLGKEGVRYRFDHDLKAKKWTSLEANRIGYVVDSAGAGDWFSAGIISSIALNGLNGFKKCNSKTILHAIKYGQALGALNCYFDGARGLMYNLDRKKIELLVKKIQANKTPLTLINNKENSKPKKNFSISSLMEE